LGGGGLGGGIPENGLEGVADAGLVEEFGEPQEFLFMGRTGQGREEACDVGGGGFGFDGERGQEAVFQRQLAGFIGGEEGSDTVGMRFEGGAYEVAFEGAVVGFADGDGLAVVCATGERFVQGFERHADQQSERRAAMRDQGSNRADDFGAHLGIGIASQWADEGEDFIGSAIEGRERPDGFATEVAMGIGEERAQGFG
jgi:hypothetical protein